MACTGAEAPRKEKKKKESGTSKRKRTKRSICWRSYPTRKERTYTRKVTRHVHATIFAVEKQ